MCKKIFYTFLYLFARQNGTIWVINIIKHFLDYEQNSNSKKKDLTNF